MSDVRDEESSGLLWGCLVIFGILLVLALGVGLWVYFEGRDFAAKQVEKAVSKALDETAIEEDERASIESEIQRLMDRFRAREIKGEELAGLVDALFEGQWKVSFLARVLERQMTKQSLLAEDRQAAVRMELRRLDFGVHAGLVSLETADQLFALAFGGKVEFTNGKADTVSGETLEAFVAEAEEVLDAAEIPEDCPKIDLAEEFRRVVEDHFRKSSEDADSEEGPREI